MKAFPKESRELLLFRKKNNIVIKFINASKRLSIAEHSVYNPTCANSYNLKTLK